MVCSTATAAELRGRVILEEARHDERHAVALDMNFADRIGERFLLASFTRDPEAPMHIVVAFDWMRDLERLAPRSRQ